MGNAVKNVLCLTLITLVAGFGLGYVYDITKEPIAVMENEQKLAAYKKVMPEAAAFSDSIESAADPQQLIASAGIEGVDIDSAVSATDASGQIVGYVINVTTHEGYGGDIAISIGMDTEGTVKGIEILKISETAGLGMKAKEPAFKDQFKDKAVKQFSYTKTGAKSDFEIDAISGATITTKAVTNAVNAGIVYYQSLGGVTN